MHGKIGLFSMPGKLLVMSIVVTVLPPGALQPAGDPSFSDMLKCEPKDPDVAAIK